LSVPKQALLDVSAAQDPTLGYGASGIAGLGFTSLSTIDAIVNASRGSTGRSLLFNLFSVNPQEPNFIAFSLQRSTEAGDEIQGIFSIGSYIYLN
jgi:saccharopepsin